MSIEVTVRHMDAGDAMQAYAKRKAEDLQEAFPEVEHIHVVMSKEKHHFQADVFAQGKKHVRVDAKETADNMTAALDVAMDKVEKQLRRVWDKIQDHKHVSKP